MKGKVTQFALAAMLAVGFAAPALAQNTNWKLNSDHSTGHLSLTSTADPNATFDVGAARVKGSVSLDASPLVNSWFDFIIYPADQDPASINARSSRKLKLTAFATIEAEDFPGLFEAVTDANWPVAVEDKNCQEPATNGEEYHGTGCTGTPVVISSRPSAAVTVADSYPGPDLDTPRVRDNVSIALHLELTRDTSVAAKAFAIDKH